MKVVLDTNILVSGIFWGGVPAQILDFWQKQKIEALASEPILEEYLNSIGRIAGKIGRTDLFDSWSLVLPSRIHFVMVKKSFQLCRDPKDNKFIDCAIAGRARYLVSGDKDLLVLGKVMQLEIITAKAFLHILLG